MQIILNNTSYEAGTIPSETAVLVDLVNLCHNGAATFENFSDAIGKDPGLTAKVLHMANSPAYRQWNDLVDLRQILIILGLRNVRQIVLSSAIKQFFEKFSHEFNEHIQMIWFRAVLCSNLTKKIAEFVSYDKPEEACLSGLMYQVGQLILLLNQPQQYPAILDQFFASDDFCALEQTAFGVDHCQLGAALLEVAKMESFLVDAVLLPLAPVEELQEAPVLIKILSVAASLCADQGQPLSGSSLARAGRLFNMTEESVQHCLEQAVEQSQLMVAALGYDEVFPLNRRDQLQGGAVPLLRAENRLAEQVKSIALVRGAMTFDDNQLYPLLGELRTGLATLFNLESLIFFQVEPQTQRLVPVNDLRFKPPQPLNLSLQNPASLLVKCYRQRQRQELSADCAEGVDQEVLQWLGKPRGAAFPVQARGRLTGVLLLAPPAGSPEFAEHNLTFIELLVHEFAQAHQRILDEEEQAPGFTRAEFLEIAHEVTNPLSIIKNYLYVLGKKVDQTQAPIEEIALINEEIARAGDILLRAKNRPRENRVLSQTLDVNALLTGLDDILQNSLYKTGNIESRLDLDPAIPALTLPQHQFQQILINLIKNAVEAMADGGHLEISTRDKIHFNGQVYVEIAIKDSGTGIPDRVLMQLFKPVKSLKPGHSGLGLSIAKNLVNELGGHVSCKSDAAGTEFKILLPHD